MSYPELIAHLQLTANKVDKVIVYNRQGKPIAVTENTETNQSEGQSLMKCLQDCSKTLSKLSIDNEIFIFMQHFLDFVSKEYVEDIAIIPLEYTQNAGVRLVVIGPAQPKHIKQAFKKLTGLSYSLYVDPEREVYKALGCQDKIATAAVENSKHIKSGFVTGMLSSVWRAMTSGDKEFQGDIQQQGGAFIFGPGDVCHFSHIDQNAADHCPLNDILTRANVMNVSFPKDPRIEIV
ncbi:peroxiredoxin-like 2C isoform X3 [Biomphalaria glabrata]|uniref:Peroxiredoxin-like 2C isoform X3 n=1 Tax=Biomphalaria glabrata TaxID=6526 RepID=A0A9W3AHH2_BIOGL|nr:peroxiredoxin-like 2C isoform X3 [Biomphalaria glabrata]